MRLVFLFFVLYNFDPLQFPNDISQLPESFVVEIFIMCAVCVCVCVCVIVICLRLCRYTWQTGHQIPGHGSVGVDSCSRGTRAGEESTRHGLSECGCGLWLCPYFPLQKLLVKESAIVSLRADVKQLKTEKKESDQGQCTRLL